MKECFIQVFHNGHMELSIMNTTRICRDHFERLCFVTLTQRQTANKLRETVGQCVVCNWNSQCGHRGDAMLTNLLPSVLLDTLRHLL